MRREGVGWPGTRRQVGGGLRIEGGRSPAMRPPASGDRSGLAGAGHQNIVLASRCAPGLAAGVPGTETDSDSRSVGEPPARRPAIPHLDTAPHFVTKALTARVTGPYNGLSAAGAA